MSYISMLPDVIVSICLVLTGESISSWCIWFHSRDKAWSPHVCSWKGVLLDHRILTSMSSYWSSIVYSAFTIHTVLVTIVFFFGYSLTAYAIWLFFLFHLLFVFIFFWQRMYKSPNSALNKARTQFLNKQRTISKVRLLQLHFRLLHCRLLFVLLPLQKHQHSFLNYFVMCRRSMMVTMRLVLAMLETRSLYV